ENLDEDENYPQVLVLCPSRELVIQVADEYKKLSKFNEDLSIAPIYGGQDIGIQLRALKKGVQVVVGTPGRIMDHMRRSTLDLKGLKYIVLDEADQMLDMGFRDDMETILSQTPKSRQTVMFSATMPKDLVKLMEKYQKSPKHVNVAPKANQSAQINQLYYDINEASKLEALKRLVSFHKIKSGLIFCNTKIKVDDLAKALSTASTQTASLHGDLDQRRRDKVMQAFKRGEIQLLIATDVAARGIDVNDLEAVINFDLPRFDQDYVHRIGRTGRAGKAGLALTFVVGKELEHLNRIARKNNMQIEEAQVPELNDLEKANFEAIKQSIMESKVNTKALKKYLAYIQEINFASVEEIAVILLKQALDAKSNSSGENIDFKPVKYSRESRSRSSGGGGGYSGRKSSGAYSGRKSSSAGSFSGRKSSEGGYKKDSSSSYGEKKSSFGEKKSSSSGSSYKKDGFKKDFKSSGSSSSRFGGAKKSFKKK
ncbi:MAG: DEAD/DEAH box helicase, partial [Candidatus Caenarcaniphilales bacterium]|nr:DEAD/DEAH box helicase [Candidatus Caenarcaniphilales bacterium]